MDIRQPAVAGLFYPDDPQTLARQIEAYLQAADPVTTVPKAIIVPHAGYIYSGPVAATAYRAISPMRDIIKRVVLLGPGHRLGFVGMAASTAHQFATPLGLVPIDQETIKALLDLPQVQQLDEAHANEHSLEVHLPFLQTVLSDFKLIPLVVGDAAPETVAEVLEFLWGGEETLIVISSDLSHYLDYETASRRDRITSSAIEQFRYTDIEYDDACGRNPVSGLLLAAANHKMEVQTVDLRNSGDTAGDRSRVVGYGAYVFH